MTSPCEQSRISRVDPRMLGVLHIPTSHPSLRMLQATMIPTPWHIHKLSTSNRIMSFLQRLRVVLLCLFLMLLQHGGLVASWSWQQRNHRLQTRPRSLNDVTSTRRRSPLFSQPPSSHKDVISLNSAALSVDQALQQRYACTRFQRYDGINTTVTIACESSNVNVIQSALQALDHARRAPSGFNAQPYKVLMVTERAQKELLAQYCIGHNAHRVRDSECTAVFLADRQTMRSLGAYRQKLLFGTESSKRNWNEQNKWALLKIQTLVGLFSQGFPAPYWISGPISGCLRFGVRVVSWMLRRRLVVPTLSSAETWSQKNTMLVAMAYLLGCTSRGLATCPMEGYLTWGIRRNLKIPRRYTIPLIVATGLPYQRPTRSSDDAGMTHGASPDTATLRYPAEDIIFQNVFGPTGGLMQ